MELMYEDELQKRQLIFVLHLALSSEAAYEWQTEQLPLLSIVELQAVERDRGRER